MEPCNQKINSPVAPLSPQGESTGVLVFVELLDFFPPPLLLLLLLLLLPVSLVVSGFAAAFTGSAVFVASGALDCAIIRAVIS